MMMRLGFLVVGGWTMLTACGGGDAFESPPLEAVGDGGAEAGVKGTGGTGTIDARAPDAPAACNPSGDPACILQPDVVAVEVTTVEGKAPEKGRALRLKITVKNLGKLGGSVRYVPLLDAKRFTDFTAVPMGEITDVLGAGEQKVMTKDVGPFFDDDARSKHYALGRGGYTISGVRVTPAGGKESLDGDLRGKDFTVAPSNVVLNAVVYDQQFLDHQKYTGSAKAFMEETHTRKGEVFTPDAPGSTTGTYQTFPGGFDEMMGIRHEYRTFAGFVATNGDGLGFCEQAGAYGGKALGMTRDWDPKGTPTNVDHHGFDTMTGLTQVLGGGVTCGWLQTEVIGLFDFDLSLDRCEIVAVHETGHVFGSPHCDPIQGYVMCSGEKHDHYKQDGTFVWLKASRDTMKNPYD